MSISLHTINGVAQERRLVTEVPGPRSQAMNARRLNSVSSGVSVALPAYMERAGGGILVDVDGNHFIDLGSGIAVTTVGNANPYVVEGVQRQVSELVHTCFMVTPYEGYVAVAEQLNELTPGDHEKRSMLVNSGAEAVENAVKIARSFTGRQAVVAVEHGYHGRTNLTMGLTAKSMPYKHNFGPFAPEIYRVPVSYPLRDNGMSGVDVAKAAILKMEKEIGATSIAAFIVEPILGEGGFVVPDTGYFSTIAAWAQANGILVIADEIQSGFCRTGQWFACEHEGVVPDLVTTAKGIAGGMPLAGVTGRADVMDSIHAGGLGGTYGGNPVACAAALGAIQWMKDEDANARAKAIEAIMIPRLRAMQANHPVIADVRGRGAMIAIELATPGSLAPDAARAGALNKHCHQHGLVTLTAGTYGNVFRFLPSLAMPLDLLEEGLHIFEEGLEHTA